MMNIQKNWDDAVPVYKVDLDETADQSTSCTVVRSIANVIDKDLDDLESLWDSVDPDALDSFVAHARESSTPYQLTFQYQGYAVKIENRWIQFTPTEETPSSVSA
ncbi:HalOD1 output domain-containing protein [Halorubrum sp. DTA46]|uniref:HalOD1 output domain-containing protein n=1 Tax=Halorubrum sp. DTA46 TaxID=3402162 RepID=UPI003AAF9CD3